MQYRINRPLGLVSVDGNFIFWENEETKKVSLTGEEASRFLFEFIKKGMNCQDVSFGVFDGNQTFNIKCYSVPMINYNEKLGVPVITFRGGFNINITCDVTIIGYGPLKEDEFALDHYEFDGEKFHSQKMADALAKAGCKFDVYGKDGNVIKADEIGSFTFPRVKAKKTSSPFDYNEIEIKTGEHFFTTYTGIRYRLV